jgi:hypothetical protein
MTERADLFGTDLRLLPFLDALHGNRDPGKDRKSTRLNSSHNR